MQVNNGHPFENASKQELTILIPAFNEGASVGQVVEGIRSQSLPFLAEIIVVDDGSSDKTATVAREAGAKVIRHQLNLGYGAALKTGIRAAKSEFVQTLDADGQHDLGGIADAWELAHQNDMVVGVRDKSYRGKLWRLPGKWLLWKLANYLTGRRIPDLNSGFRIFRRSTILKYLHICPNGFSFSTTSTLAFVSKAHRIAYMPVAMLPRKKGRSRVTPGTGLKTIILILRLMLLFGPLRVFLPMSAIIAVFGFGWGIPYAWTGKGVSVGSMLAIVVAFLLFILGLVSDQISQLRLERYE